MFFTAEHDVSTANPGGVFDPRHARVEIPCHSWIRTFSGNGFARDPFIGALRGVANCLPIREMVRTSAQAVRALTEERAMWDSHQRPERWVWPDEAIGPTHFAWGSLTPATAMDLYDYLRWHRQPGFGSAGARV